jgi:hypothetical protein
MLKNHITIDETVIFLNELIEIDKSAIAALIANRVPCNKKLADHPTVQVSAQNDGFHVGLLGILNGLFGTLENGHGPITFVFSDGNLQSVRRTTINQADKREVE